MYGYDAAANGNIRVGAGFMASLLIALHLRFVFTVRLDVALYNRCILSNLLI